MSPLTQLDQDTLSDEIKDAIPNIAATFEDEDEDVRISALQTCSDIATALQSYPETQKKKRGQYSMSPLSWLNRVLSAALRDTLSGITLNILTSTPGWRTRIAVLRTLSTFAETGLSDGRRLSCIMLAH